MSPISSTPAPVATFTEWTKHEGYRMTATLNGPVVELKWDKRRSRWLETTHHVNVTRIAYSHGLTEIYMEKPPRGWEPVFLAGIVDAVKFDDGTSLRPMDTERREQAARQYGRG